jgi:hypothetical protein
MPRIAAPDGSSTGSNAGGSAFNFACDAGSAQPERPSSSEISDYVLALEESKRMKSIRYGISGLIALPARRSGASLGMPATPVTPLRHWLR